MLTYAGFASSKTSTQVTTRSRDGMAEERQFEHRGLATLRPAGDQNVQAGDHRGLEKTRGRAGKGPEVNQVLEVICLDHEPAHCLTKHLRVALGRLARSHLLHMCRWRAVRPVSGTAT